MRQILENKLIKILTVGILLVIFVILGRYGWKLQGKNAWRDATRKDDLARITQAVQDYFQAHKGFADVEAILKSCGSGMLQPYLKAVPCDPLTGEVYFFRLKKECQNCYELFAKLENFNDPVIKELGCDQGCGPEGQYNYRVSGQAVLLEQERR